MFLLLFLLYWGCVDRKGSVLRRTLHHHHYELLNILNILWNRKLLILLVVALSFDVNPELYTERQQTHRTFLARVRKLFVLGRYCPFRIPIIWKVRWAEHILLYLLSYVAYRTRWSWKLQILAQTFNPRNLIDNRPLEVSLYPQAQYHNDATAMGPTKTTQE